MKIVWIHGAPAAGKLTVAKELSNSYGFKLFHNHLAVDLSLSIYDEFGEKDFHDFTDEIRRIALRKAKSLGVSTVVMTWVVCSEIDQYAINTYLDFFAQENMDVFPIHLSPTKNELLNRVVSHERQMSHKVSCDKQLADHLEQFRYEPIRTPQTLKIDNTKLPPSVVAEKILEHINHTSITR